MNSEPVIHLCKKSLQFKVVNNFDKKLHFKIYCGVLNLPGVFFQIYN